MKKTSRRTFGKVMAASLASLPVMSIANASEGDSGVRNENTTAPQRFLDDRNQHDTPPTFTITQGSFIIEIDKPLAFVTTGAGKKTYRRPKQNHDAHLDHIKIVDGSGEMLYRNDAARDCQILVTLERSLEAKIYGGSELILEMTDSLDAGTAQTGPRKRPHKYVPSSAEILEIKVQRGGSPIYSVRRAETVSRLEDVRIMVWHEDH